MSLQFIITVRECGPHEREMVQRITGVESLASDHCIGVFLGSRLVGWGDDYGTVQILPDEELTVTTELEALAEKLLENATELYTAYTRAKGMT